MTETPLFHTLSPAEPGSDLQRLLAGFSVNLGLVVVLLTLGPSPWQPASTNPSRKIVLVRLPDPRSAEVQPPPEPIPTPRLPRKAPLPAVRPNPASPAPAAMPAPPVLATAPAAPVTAPIHTTVPAIARPQPVLGSFADTTIATRPNLPRPAEAPRPAFEEAAPQTKTSRGDFVQVGALDSQNRQVISRNRREIIASTGFEQSATASVKLAANRVTAESGFDTRLSSEPTSGRRRVEEGSFEPVEILTKPKPKYTEAARRLGIEGEVSLRILFGSDGKLKVLGIVQGLGYGLDENAASAAARIEFRPARRGGQPVEQAAVVRVQFYLAQ